MANLKPIHEYLPLASILILAFCVRFIGIWFGLPDLYHADEPIVVNRALYYGAGDLNPHYFKIPPFVSYVLYISYGIYYLIGPLLGMFSGVEDFAQLFFTDPTSFYLIGRMLLGVGLGTASIYAMYRLGKKFFSKAHGLLAAFFFALSFLHVRDSHYIYLDIPLLLILVLCFFPILNIVNKGLRRDYLLFGVFAGIAVGTKYNGFFILVPFFVAHFLKYGPSLRSLFRLDLYLAGLLSAIAFIAVNPFALLDYRSFFGHLFTMRDFEGYIGFIHHLRYSTVNAFGISMLLLAAAGIVLAFIQKDKKKFPILFFTVSYYVVLCFFSQVHDRYVLPVLPFLTFFVADALIQAQKHFRYGILLQCFLAVLVILPSFGKIILCDRLLMVEDVRTTARHWIESNISENARIALDDSFFSPRLKPNLKQLEDKYHVAQATGDQAQLTRIETMLSLAKTKESRRYEIYFLTDAESPEFLFAKPTLPYDVKALKKQGIEYIVISKTKEGFRRDFYDQVVRQPRSIFLKRFSPYKDPKRHWPISDFPMTGAPSVWSELIARNQNGHIIEIYKL